VDKPSVREVPWTLRDVSEAGIVLIFLVVLGYFIRFFLLDVPTFKGNRPLAAFLSFFLIYALLVLIVWLFAVKKYKGSLKDLGVLPFNLWRGIKIGFFWLIVIKIFTLIYAATASALGLEPPPELAENIPRLFGTGYTGLIFAVVITVFIAPVAEELVFRGFLYPAFRKRLGMKWAVFLSAVVFALFHPSVWLILPIVLIGVILAILFERLGSLGPPIILHSFNNLLSLVLLYYFR